MYGVRGMPSGRSEDARLLPFQETRRLVGATGGVVRGRSTVDVTRIVGSDGKSGWFDEGFMPLGGVSQER